jgi:hypothetical protein
MPQRHNHSINTDEEIHFYSLQSVIIDFGLASLRDALSPRKHGRHGKIIQRFFPCLPCFRGE